MPKYRGNVGNLLQHWVHCEILAACQACSKQMAFVDAHSMAPFATERSKRDTTANLFDLIRDGLPGEQSPYEQTWYELAQGLPRDSGYPNSAAFLVTLWRNRYSLLLCEKDEPTVQELRRWSKKIVGSPKCERFDIFEGDWRDRFGENRLPQGDLVFISFDPYMFNRHPVKDPDSGNMYPDDLKSLASAVRGVSHGLIVQLSTYSANDANSQEQVLEEVVSRVKDCELELAAMVRPNGQMMSLVLTRNIGWSDCFRSLPDRFESWLERTAGGQFK